MSFIFVLDKKKKQTRHGALKAGLEATCAGGGGRGTVPQRRLLEYATRLKDQIWGSAYPPTLGAGYPLTGV